MTRPHPLRWLRAEVRHRRARPLAVSNLRAGVKRPRGTDAETLAILRGLDAEAATPHPPIELRRDAS